jgi:hypothetical protein
VLLQRKAARTGNALLALLDLGIEEFLHAAAVEAHQVVVVLALVELVDGLARFEVVARQQPCLLELREHAIDRGQANVHMLGEQDAIHVFSAQMALFAGLEDLEDLQPRHRGFQTDVLEVCRTRHAPGSLEYNVRIFQS